MRGYGTLQTMTALEVLIDEAAQALRLDPIEFRSRNALPTGGKTMTGNPLVGITRTNEVLDKLGQHPIWRERAAAKTGAQQKAGILVGTGVACVTKDFGTGADCTLSRVAISPEGRITIHSDAVEMGTGVGTALANRVAAVIGGVADEVTVANVEAYAPLALVTSGDPLQHHAVGAGCRIAQPALGAGDQFGVERIDRRPYQHARRMRSGARHLPLRAVAGRARALGNCQDRPAGRRNGISAQWQDRQLMMPGLAPLDLAVLAAKAHARSGVTGAMVHGFNRWEWSRASFSVAGEIWTADIDALAVRAGAGAFARLDRTKISFPPAVNERIGTSYSSVCGTLVRIEIDRKSGQVRVAKAYSAVECGQALVPEVVVGQAQGGFAMGVGYALLESLPLYEGGPGDGKWNLGRYLITRVVGLAHA